MRIYSEISIRDFEFWSGAKDTAARIKNYNAWDTVENVIEDIYPDGMTDTELNDLFWFDSDTVFEWAGIPTEEQEEAKKTIDEIEEENPDFVDWVCNEYCLLIDEVSNWEEIAEYLEDEDIMDEYREFLEEQEEN